MAMQLIPDPKRIEYFPTSAVVTHDGRELDVVHISQSKLLLFITMSSSDGACAEMLELLATLGEGSPDRHMLACDAFTCIVTREPSFELVERLSGLWPGDWELVADRELHLLRELDLVTPTGAAIPAAFTVHSSLLIPWRQVSLHICVHALELMHTLTPCPAHRCVFHLGFLEKYGSQAYWRPSGHTARAPSALQLGRSALLVKLPTARRSR